METDRNGAIYIEQGMERKKPGYKVITGKILPQLVMIFFAILFIFPFVWLLSTSLKTVNELYITPSLATIFPSHPRWSNYVDALTGMPFFLYFKNSLILAVIPVIGQLFGSTLTAYSLARIPWKGAKPLFTIMLATMIIPSAVTMIPIYIVMAKIGWTGTFLPLTALTFLGYPYFIFLLRQFFKTIPMEISESAKIDGAGELRIYLQLILPLTTPALSAVGILQFQWAWNDLQQPLIYLHSSKLWPLALGLTNFMRQDKIDWQRLLPTCVMFILPMVVVFAVGQKYFIKGIATTGIK